jgi:hypothetical protein
MPYQFNEGQKVQSNIFNFTSVGQSVQGTYLGRTLKHSPKYNKDLYLYDLKTESNEIISVWGRPIIDSNMKFVKPGQIVEFRFVGVKPTPKGNDMKLIDVYADEKVIDENWLKAQEEEAMLENIAEQNTAAQQQTIDNVNFMSAPKQETKNNAPVANDDTQKLNLIGELSKMKLGVVNPDAVPVEVMNAINLAFVPANYDNIIKQLEVLPETMLQSPMMIPRN